MKRQVKTEIQKEIEDMLELNEYGYTTYPSSCDTMKTVLRCKVTVKSGSMKKNGEISHQQLLHPKGIDSSR